MALSDLSSEPQNSAASATGTAPMPVAAPSVLSPSGYSNHAIHLVRTAQQINVAMSQMADSKASILMGATFLVFSISVGQARNGTLPPPLAVLALFAFLSAVFAVVAVLPSLAGTGRRRHPGDPAPNLLFFGQFTAMPEDEWTEAVLDNLKADETVFRVMLHDMYCNGQVLQHKKYRYLGLAYRTFLIGLCATGLTFGAEVIYYSSIHH